MRGAEPGSSAISCARLASYRPALRLALLGSTAILLSALLVAPSRANDECGSLSGELTARLGLAAFHLDLALRHEFMGETSAEVSGLSFSDQLPGTTVRVASGFDWSGADGRFNLSLDAGYARGSDADELSTTAALRLNY